MRFLAGLILAGAMQAQAAMLDGCEALRCLAADDQVFASGACKAVAEQLGVHMESGLPLPECEAAIGAEHQSWLRYAMNFYDPCPPGMGAITGGVSAVWSRAYMVQYRQVRRQDVHTEPVSVDAEPPAGVKTCAADFAGAHPFTVVEEDGALSVQTLSVFRKMVFLRPYDSPYAIDAIVGGQIVRRWRPWGVQLGAPDPLAPRGER